MDIQDEDLIDDEAPVILIFECACGTEFTWRVGLEEPETRCAACRASGDSEALWD